MKLIVLILIILKSQFIYSESPYNFVVWNVGQGSWATLMSIDKCFHIDIGGEKYPDKVDQQCAGRNNIIYITHEDWDHISYFQRFSRKTKFHCLVKNQTFTKKYLQLAKKCKGPLPSFIRRIDKGSSSGSRNQMSSIYIVLNKVLITGDAPIKREKIWMRKVDRTLPILILGHHGSHTSTSVKLLNRIRPSFAIASARKTRYSHPHKTVSEKLKNRRIPLLRTEIWGHIFMTL